MQPDSQQKPVVLITGATSGLGKALAVHLHERGYQVFGSSRNPDAQNTSYNLVRIDLADATSIQQAVREIVDQTGRLDIIINNAGVGIAGPLESLPADQMKQVLQANLLGLAYAMQTVLPVMRAQGSGKIVNISSVASEVALPFRSMYSASKAAVNRMTEAMRMEVAPYGIQATSILIGDMRTPINQNRLMHHPGEDSVYAPVFERAAAAMNKEVDEGVPPEQIARQIEALLQKKSLKKQYTMGKPLQRVAVYLARALPGNLFERLLRTYSKV